MELDLFLRKLKGDIFVIRGKSILIIYLLCELKEYIQQLITKIWEKLYTMPKLDDFYTNLQLTSFIYFGWIAWLYTLKSNPCYKNSSYFAHPSSHMQSAIVMFHLKS